MINYFKRTNPFSTRSPFLFVCIIFCFFAATFPMLLAHRSTSLAFLISAPLRITRATSTARTSYTSAPPPASVCAAPKMTATASISGPAWDLTDEYPSLTSPSLAADIATAKSEIEAMTAASAPITAALSSAPNMSVADAESAGVLAALEDVNTRSWAAAVLLRNVATYGNCIASADGANEGAKKLIAGMTDLFAARTQGAAAADLFLQLCSDEVAEAYFARSEETEAGRFLVEQNRVMREHALELAEENMLSSYGVSGLHAWGDLYTDLSSTLEVDVEGRGRMGVAAAAGLLDSGDGEVRKAAWLGIKAAWMPHTETSAAILNALSKWRLETYARRGLADFLVTPLHENRMQRESLDAMFAAVDRRGIAIGRRALAVQAATIGKERLEPWDLLAPAPTVPGSGEEATLYTFDEGIELIASAVGAVDEKAGVFVRMMRDKGWIEASRGDTKRPGAFCSGFAKSRNPRVYLSEYNGGAGLLLTLAHELGHAFHSWVTRDLPHSQTAYPMTLAETASIFFETVVAADLLERAKTPAEKFAIAFTNAETTVAFCLNIPSRFKFEFDLYTKRLESKVSKAEIDALMVSAWKHYYGDSLARVDEVGIFSATKLHFSLSTESFYNFSYTCGWLFSLSVYAARDKLGVDFAEVYTNLLRDTGRMDAETCISTWLGADITETEFWEGGLAIAEQQIIDLEEYAKASGFKL